MATELQRKMIEKIVSRNTSVYDVMYFYGNQQAIRQLLTEIEEKYQAARPNSRILRTTAARLREEYIRHLLNGTHGCYTCDLFILENIQELAGSEYAEQRLYGHLDWLLENRRQLIITGTEPVGDILCLAPRIRAQIEGGICLQVE